MGTEVAVQNTGTALFRASTDAAQLCKEIVTATAQNIGDKRYVKVEGWQAIAIAHGCVASSGSVERVDTGFRAIGKVIRMDTGTEISTAEGFVGDDEDKWARRPEYARRAMAQTRAISRACRSAFAHVVVMMNAGLSTTPAEEAPDDPEPELDLSSIEKADDMASLKIAFDRLNKHHRDADSRARIAAAKDRRKVVVMRNVIDSETGEVI